MKTKHILLATCLLATSSVSAKISIDTVLVGDAGNASDYNGFGGVAYDYHIGTYEVTNAQYAAFLNAVDTSGSNPNDIYSGSMSSNPSGGIEFDSGAAIGSKYSTKAGFDNKPVNFVTFWDAARFTNWLTNGQGSGDTETGIYDLTGLTTANADSFTVTRSEAAWNAGGVAVVSENEWYKAAYYSGSPSSTGSKDFGLTDVDGYWQYATQSNEEPTPAGSNTTDANSANFESAVGGVTVVGSYSMASSLYGTFDQAGNVHEWTASDDGSEYALRGGTFGTEGATASFTRGVSAPTTNYVGAGFRVSSIRDIPEPSSYTAILSCLSLSLAFMRRKPQTFPSSTLHGS